VLVGKKDVGDALEERASTTVEAPVVLAAKAVVCVVDVAEGAEADAEPFSWKVQLQPTLSSCTLSSGPIPMQ